MAQTYVPGVQSELSNISCLDAIAFQSRLISIRKFDDKIINILNDAIPTESFYSKKGNPAKICDQLKTEVNSYYDSRERAIQKCVEYAEKDLKTVKPTDDISELREKNRSLFIFKQELEIESIYKGRSLKAINERCSKYV